MKTKNNENNEEDARLDYTVFLNIALSCVFCNIACKLCREWLVEGFNPEDAILSSDLIELQHGVDGWFLPTAGMCVSAVLHFAAKACPVDGGVRKSTVDPRSGKVDYGRMLEKLFDKSIAEHKSSYSVHRISENTALIKNMESIANGSVMGVVRNYLRDLRAAGDGHLVGADGGPMSYKKVYRAGRAKLLKDILEEVKLWYSPLSKYADEIKEGKRKADIASAETCAMERAVDMTMAYMNKIGDGCGDLMPRTIVKVSSWRFPQFSAASMTGFIHGKLAETAYAEFTGAVAECVGSYIKKSNVPAGSLKKLLDNTWNCIKSLRNSLRGI